MKRIITALCIAGIAALSLSACDTTIGHGAPMGGRGYEHGSPSENAPSANCAGWGPLADCK